MTKKLSDNPGVLTPPRTEEPQKSERGFRLRGPVRDRIEELYYEGKPERGISGDKGIAKTAVDYASVLSNPLASLTLPLQMLQDRNAGTGWDPLRLGYQKRGDLIDTYVKANKGDLVDSYNNGSFGSLDKGMRDFHRVTDDEIVKALSRIETDDRDNLVGADIDYLEDDHGIVVNDLTRTGEIRSLATEFKGRAQLEKDIRGIPTGADVLTQWKKDNPDKELDTKTLEGIKTSLKPKTDAGRLLDSKLETADQDRKNSTRELDQRDTELGLKGDQIAIQRTQVEGELAVANRNADISQTNVNNQAIDARNKNTIAMSEIDYKNALARYQHSTEVARMKQEAAQANLDRNLRKDLAVLGMEDKAADRSAAREDRQADNRQMMILQLMKGLGNLGQSMAI